MTRGAHPLAPRQRCVVEWLMWGTDIAEVAVRLGITAAEAEREARATLRWLLGRVGNAELRTEGSDWTASSPGAVRQWKPPMPRTTGERILQAEVEHARRTGRSLAVLLLTFLEAPRRRDRALRPGDTAAREVWEVLRRPLRRTDWVVHWGDATYLLILPGCDREGLASTLSRIRALEPRCALIAGTAELWRGDSAATLVRRAERASAQAGLASRAQRSLWLAAQKRTRPVSRPRNPGRDGE